MTGTLRPHTRSGPEAGPGTEPHGHGHGHVDAWPSDPALTDDDRYQALLRRDAAHDGRWFVAVRTTGIFCRPSCPARRPLRGNCEFFATAGECLQAGYRPCRRCDPLCPAAAAGSLVTGLLEQLARNPGRRWREADVRALGHDPSTVRRAFRRQFGVTFIELARLTRLRGGFAALADGGGVIDAQLEAGFDSPSGFRAAFARLLGMAPGSLARRAGVWADWIDTPLGPMVAVADQARLQLLDFADRRTLAGALRRLHAEAPIGIGRPPPTAQVAAELAEYFAARGARFATPLQLRGSEFSRRVWRALRQIPPGETRSYAAVAAAIGQPAAVRAVARANGANPLAIVVPCHRVIGSDGSLTGYGGGLWRKRQLIELERRLRGGAE